MSGVSRDPCAARARRQSSSAMSTRRPLSSRERYRAFVEDYRQRRLDDSTDAAATPGSVPSSDGAGVTEKKTSAKPKASPNRRRYIRDYLRWLRPHRFAIGAVFLLALVS